MKLLRLFAVVAGQFANSHISGFECVTELLLHQETRGDPSQMQRIFWYFFHNFTVFSLVCMTRPDYVVSSLFSTWTQNGGTAHLTEYSFLVLPNIRMWRPAQRVQKIISVVSTLFGHLALKISNSAVDLLSFINNI